MKMVEDNFLKLFVHLFLFSENDVPLTFDGGGFKLRVLEDIGENVDSSGDIRVERLGVVDGVFTLI
jgi:hypothetical protein